MKLVGEYELTEQGVKIEGKIHDSHIHEVRALLKPFKTSRIYRGEVEQSGQVYHVPHPQYRSHIIRNVPGILTPEAERDFVALPQHVDSDLEMYYQDCNTFMQNMGIMYGEGEGRHAMDERRIFQYYNAKRQKSRLLTNSAWVWGADERGNFDIEILGMINRHMMTVLLANATKMAKYIDTVLVRILDKADEFTPAKIEQAQVTAVRRTNVFSNVIRQEVW